MVKKTYTLQVFITDLDGFPFNPAIHCEKYGTFLSCYPPMVRIQKENIIRIIDEALYIRFGFRSKRIIIGTGMDLKIDEKHYYQGY